MILTATQLCTIVNKFQPQTAQRQMRNFTKLFIYEFHVLKLMYNTQRNNFLRPLNLNVQQRRETMTTNPSNEFVAKVSLETPAADYEQLINEKVQADDVIDDDQSQSNYRAIAEAARDTVWKLLFEEETANAESQDKASELLFKLKADACFYDPWTYNNWIGGVRDELLKREMLDFWRDEMVEKELGPCWARDSDFFDDMEDSEPAAFYNYAGCVAPFGQVSGDKPVVPQYTLPQSTTADRLDIAADFDTKITEETPLQDYEQLIKEKVRVDQLVEDDVIKHNYQKIAVAARAIIWNFLFSTQPASKETQTKAAELLYKVKADACFYDPWSYNKWVGSVRDELLKREMLEFWRDQMVENELGPCWARDSDYFDDMEDPEPAAFYNHAGCVAPFGQVTGNKAFEAELDLTHPTSAGRKDITADFVPKISLERPVQDYEDLIREKVQVDQLVEDDVIKHNYQKIAVVARDTACKLLFTEERTASKEQQGKAAELLYKMKADACFYDPWSYNKWIGGVRDELLKREMFDFWREQMVVDELGPCWARDCDFFDDMDDPEPAEFYKHAGCVAPFSKAG